MTDQGNDVVRITLSSILILVVLSSFFWDGFSGEKKDPPSELKQNIAFLKVSALLVSFFLCFYLFFISLAYLPLNGTRKNDAIDKIIISFKKSMVDGANLSYSVGVVSGLFYLGVFTFFQPNVYAHRGFVILFTVLLIIYIIRKNKFISNSSSAETATRRG